MILKTKVTKTWGRAGETRFKSCNPLMHTVWNTVQMSTSQEKWHCTVIYTVQWSLISNDTHTII